MLFDDDIFADAVKKYLAENLRIEVKTTREYTGGMGDGPLYSDCHTVQLLLNGEIISEASS